jgi:RNA polymerase sigma-70 factor (ECF subfamily)
VTPDQERQAEALMRAAQAGEMPAYTGLLVLLTSVARRYAVSRLGAVPWAEDVVQDTLLAVHVARHTYDARRPFAPWFYAILKSRLVDVVRRERRIAGRELRDDERPEPASDQPRARSEVDVEAIRQALEALPDRQRRVIEGLKYRDESVREVARRLGLSESAVKVTAHRGYRALKRLLGGK